MTLESEYTFLKKNNIWINASVIILATTATKAAVAIVIAVTVTQREW